LRPLLRARVKGHRQGWIRPRDAQLQRGCGTFFAAFMQQLHIVYRYLRDARSTIALASVSGRCAGSAAGPSTLSYLVILVRVQSQNQSFRTNVPVNCPPRQHQPPVVLVGLPNSPGLTRFTVELGLVKFGALKMLLISNRTSRL